MHVADSWMSHHASYSMTCVYKHITTHNSHAHGCTGNQVHIWHPCALHYNTVCER